MYIGSKQFTFKGLPSQYPESFNNSAIDHRSHPSPTFKTPQKSHSVGVKEYENVDQSFGDSRKRRHKIFEENKSFVHQQSYSSEKRKRKSIFEKDNNKIEMKGEPALVSKQGQPHPSVELSMKSPFEYKDLIQKKLAERTSNFANPPQHAIKQKMALKERQIRFLKLEIERYRRCEIINKQNDELYKKLTAKLKERATEADLFTDPIETPDATTPIHSLTQIKFVSPPVERSTQPKFNQHHNNQSLKTIPENEENNLNTEVIAVDLYPAFLSSPKAKNHNKNRPPPKLLTLDRENDPIYLQIKQKLNDHPLGYKKDMREVPINVRLQEMNRNLEMNLNNNVRRTNSRPHSQSLQKPNKIDKSLYKSHYYAMMQ